MQGILDFLARMVELELLLSLNTVSHHVSTTKDHGSVNSVLCGRIGVDETLKVPGVEDVYSIGDCSGYLERTNKTVLPALAQVRSACPTCTIGNPYNYVSLCQYCGHFSLNHA